jgi:hypothetical protein
MLGAECADGQFDLTAAAWPPNGCFIIVRDRTVHSSGILNGNSAGGRRAARDRTGPSPRGFYDPWEQQDVRLPLMVPFTILVRNLLVHRPTQRSFAEENDLR